MQKNKCLISWPCSDLTSCRRSNFESYKGDIESATNCVKCRYKVEFETKVLPLFPEHDPIVLRRIQRDQVQRQMFGGGQQKDSLESNEESSSSSVGPNSTKQHPSTALDLKEVEGTLGGRQLPNR